MLSKILGILKPSAKTESFNARVGKEYTVAGNLFKEQDPINVCKHRMKLGMGGFIFCFCVIIFRLFDVLSFAEQNNGNKSVLQASAPKRQMIRADIVDANSSLLATSLPTVILNALPKKILSYEDVARQLSSVIDDMTYEEIYAKINRPKAHTVNVKRNITPTLQQTIHNMGIPGIVFEKQVSRIYPHRNLFSHLIGRVNTEGKGVSGAEKFFDDRLENSQLPLELSVDAAIQEVISTELSNAMKEYKAKGAYAILMNVNNGEIVSMVSKPDFNPNIRQTKIGPQHFNFIVSGIYEPGSVFKVFNTALALESGKVKASQMFDATKPIKIGGHTITDFHGENRWMNMSEILIYSSNIGSAQIAFQVGKEEQREFLDKLGFFEPLKIELAEGSRPIFHKVWRDSTLATVSYGHGISVSPLQIISAFSAMVNGGIFYKPTIMKLNGSVPEGKRVISYNTSKQLRKMLKGVVEKGSGKSANVLGYDVGGKTGTANKLSNGRYVENGKVYSTFISTFPVSSPQYALMVIIDEPQITSKALQRAAGWNAVPTSYNIIKQIAPQLNIKPDSSVDELTQKLINISYEQ